MTWQKKVAKEWLWLLITVVVCVVVVTSIAYFHFRLECKEAEVAEANFNEKHKQDKHYSGKVGRFEFEISPYERWLVLESPRQWDRHIALQEGFLYNYFPGDIVAGTIIAVIFVYFIRFTWWSVKTVRKKRAS